MCVSTSLSIISFFKNLIPKKKIIVLEYIETLRRGEYQLILENKSLRKIIITNLLINEKPFPKSFSITEQNRKYPLTINPLQKITYTHFLTRGNHYEKLTLCKIYIKRFWNDKVITQIL